MGFVFFALSASLFSLQWSISYSMMDIYKLWSTLSLTFSALSKKYWSLSACGKISKPYLKFFWVFSYCWQCFLIQWIHHLSYIFLARYWSQGWLFKTTVGVTNVITWSFGYMNCFRGLLLIVIYAAVASKTWTECSQSISSPCEASNKTLSCNEIFGFIFRWLKKNRLVGRQNCVGDKMEKIISNLWLSSIAMTWADSARAATDLSFHWWGVTELLKCQT